VIVLGTSAVLAIAFLEPEARRFAVTTARVSSRCIRESTGSWTAWEASGGAESSSLSNRTT
jgi:hypothetical protein